MKEKTATITGRPLKPRFGMNRVLIDDVLQYEAKWWLGKFPSWSIKLLIGYYKRMGLTK